MSHSYRFTFESEIQCERKGYDHGSEISELLEQQCRSCFDDLRNRHAGYYRNLCDKCRNTYYNENVRYSMLLRTYELEALDKI